MMEQTLTADQIRALGEILAAVSPGGSHILTGYAGSGKTTLMWHLTRALHERRQSVALTAPTHKAVAVLSAKLRTAGIEGVTCRTIQSLLSLKPKPHGDRLVFERDKRAEPVMVDVVVIDECSMVDADLLRHIHRHLPVSFVLFVGDPAQLPPVGEKESRTFGTESRSHLDTIVRQGADNPVLAAATAIRESQGRELDMTWAKSVNAPPHGLFVPGKPGDWLKRTFTSAEFDADPDSFRYLAWTNKRVAEVNDRVRRWRYGDDIATPFMPGERALFRAPVIADEKIIFATNEEAKVMSICQIDHIHQVPSADNVYGWTESLPVWRMDMESADGEQVTVYMPADVPAYNKVIARITDEAAECRARWKHLHDFKSSLANLQSIYAMTVHTSQGSTFRNAFVDVGDIKRRAETNVLEAQQLFYVAATRPTTALILV
jgi:energy-coupling factor transporter ATP-binding protein EcfA2